MNQPFESIKPNNRTTCAKQLRYLLLFCLQALDCFAFSQKQNLAFDHLGINMGLSESNDLCTFQEKQGFIRFGHYGG